MQVTPSAEMLRTESALAAPLSKKSTNPTERIRWKTTGEWALLVSALFRRLPVALQIAQGAMPSRSLNQRQASGIAVPIWLVRYRWQGSIVMFWRADLRSSGSGVTKL